MGRNTSSRTTARIIIAMDSPKLDIDSTMKFIENSCSLVVGYKVGLPLLLEYGVRIVSKLRSKCKERLWIADLKLADIAPIMSLTINVIEDFFEAVIAHSFIGYEDALDLIKEVTEGKGMKLILVYTMSHKGSLEVYDKASSYIEEVIRKVKPWGIVAPATMPNKIKRAREKFPSLVILSPGIGAQGAKPGEALCAGADIEIIGRSVMSSPNPLTSLRNIIIMQENMVRKCMSV